MTGLASLSLLSEYQIDHIVYLAESSITVGAGGYDTLTFDHGLSFTPLPLGEYSITSTFDTSNSLGTSLGNDYHTYIGANSSSIVVEIDNFSNPNPITIFVRVYGLLPSGIDPDVSPTALNSNNLFLFHTKYNLDKIYKQDVISASQEEVITIPHNLGYMPKVRVWHFVFDRTEPLISAYVGGGSGDFSTIDDTNLYLSCGQFGGTTFDYKIYVDN